MGKHWTTLGHRKELSPTYNTWKSIKDRIKDYSKPAYFGKEVDDRWLGENGFVNFLSDMGERPKGKTIHRIDDSKGYFPDNCEWASSKKQIREKKSTKLNVNEVWLIKKLLCDGWKKKIVTMRFIANMFRVHFNTIHDIKNGRNWGDIKYVK